MINNRQNGRRRGRGGQGAPRPNGSSGGQDRGNRIDNRARGNAAQLLEKYKALARDAQMQGDRVNTEYYLQFADHYFRVLSESRSRFEDQQPRPRRDDYAAQSDEDYGDEGDRFSGDEPRQQQAEPPAYAPRDADMQRDFADREADGNRGDGHRSPRGDDDNRRPRRGDEDDRRLRRNNRAPRDEQDHAQTARPAPAPAPAPAAEAAAPADQAEIPQPRRRGRPPKVRLAEPVSEQIEVDRLPPSFSLQIQENEGEKAPEKPRTRTRRPREKAATA